jgi:hypothetical protein
MVLWLETALYSASAWRNRFARDPERKERRRHHLTLIALLRQAWKDTHGGRVSPPRPW